MLLYFSLPAALTPSQLVSGGFDTVWKSKNKGVRKRIGRLFSVQLTNERPCGAQKLYDDMVADGVVKA